MTVTAKKDCLKGYMDLIDPERLTVEQFARSQGVARATVYWWIQTGAISCIKIGGRYYFEWSDIDEFVRQQRTKKHSRVRVETERVRE